MIKKHPGRLLVIEGIDGAGKDSLARALQQKLAFPATPTANTPAPPVSHCHWEEADIVITTQPVPTSEYTQKIEAVLAQTTHLTRPQTQALAQLYIKDRLQHQYHLQKWLAQGKTVLCVRYDLSTYAYQGASWGAERPSLFKSFYQQHRYQHPQGCLIPAITFFLDISVSLSQERVAIRKNKQHFYEKQKIPFIQNIRQSYQEAINFLINSDNRIIITLDAQQPLPAIVAQCLVHVDKLDAQLDDPTVQQTYLLNPTP